ncbi:disease resistance protein RGA2 isoform X2 [Spinacia oleracea]|uniref:Disease resistance protein RGA2 isoform X2 n=1 Tax=Spinacia oleracea TaxID=3562 RepID=A0ABM3RF56_SPIOL|nr:disease resistance protein RGA2-like isoform X2 [Spinacia oleracea]
MAEIGYSVCSKLIEVMGSKIIKEICDMWGYNSHLEDLNKSVLTIKDVLLDAEAKRDLSREQQSYIAELKDVVYDADDLFDEFLTLAELKQIDGNNKGGGKFSKKVRRFFSSNKEKMGQAYKMSHMVKEIKKQLGEIVDRYTKFGFIVDYKPIIRRREETCSYFVGAKEIVGRDKDKDVIIGMLLDHDNDCSFLAVVGVGGVGKTTLAQLVYNDERVKSEFQDLRYWVCVSDQDGGQFDDKRILCKIIELVTGQIPPSNESMESVRKKFQEELGGKKYFLVLDDVWNEDRQKWLHLENFLKLGQGGSKIVVTTRSEKTANVIGKRQDYKLECLSAEDSWRLFEMSAFDEGHGQENYDELVTIGKKIVEKCYNNPLAITVVGSLLFGQEINKWRSFESSGLAQIANGDNQIFPILKLSYHNLPHSLKSCFSYCAVFPKDYEIKKEMLIDLWIAQGYIIPLDGGQSIEDAAEEHFVILLRRCFFQDVKKDSLGNVDYVKIHDLMHDVAQEVGKEEICVVTSGTKKLADKIRHVGCVVDRDPEIVFLCSNKIRSYISGRCIKNPVDSQIDNWMCLRVLDLSDSCVKDLSDSIGKLLHLRYLNLSSNIKLEIIPDAITRLHNLQTLLLEDCRSLKELPKDFCKLVKLRHLELQGCHDLIGMSFGMDKLTSLRILPNIVVGRKEQSVDDELKALKGLTEIKGSIDITIYSKYRRVEGMNGTGGGAGYLKSMKHLTGVNITFDEGGCVNPEAVLATLEPPSNIKRLEMWHYSGTTIPVWGRAEINWAISLSHLVDITLEDCYNLQEMPVLSKLPHLKSLELTELDNLEYMESRSSSSSSDTEAATPELPTFFPSLEKLTLWRLDKLKGFGNRRSSSFPRLSKLEIWKCPDLTSFPSCPSLEELELKENNEALQIIVKITTTRGKEEKEEDKNAGVGNSQDDDNVKLWKVEIDNLGYLKSLPTNCLTHLDLTISDSKEGEGEWEVGDAFQKCVSSLRSLTIIGNHGINKVKRLSGRTGLEHFTLLESLKLSDIEDQEDEGEDNIIFWKSFPQNLRSLRIKDSDKMTSLPMGMQYLTSLQTLYLHHCYELNSLPEWISSLSSLQYLRIYYCPALKSLPEAMRNLTSLQTLGISDCPDLVKRCRKPNGKDYPKIQHIPKIIIW